VKEEEAQLRVVKALLTKVGREGRNEGGREGGRKKRSIYSHTITMINT